jgi:hypothetical protein
MEKRVNRYMKSRTRFRYPSLDLIDRLTISQDTRDGMRLLRQAPGFTALAAIVLAVGIGAMSAISSIVDAVILRHFHSMSQVDLQCCARMHPVTHAAELSRLAR